MIEGVEITPLKKIDDVRGSVLHMMRKDTKIFRSFGEIYFSIAYPKAIKAWHLHKEATLNYTCVSGRVKLVLYDDRIQSDSRGKYQEIILSPEKYYLITIPPNIWNGFKGLGESESIIANCLNLPHNEKEMVREDPHSKKFQYDWKK